MPRNDHNHSLLPHGTKHGTDGSQASANAALYKLHSLEPTPVPHLSAETRNPGFCASSNVGASPKPRHGYCVASLKLLVYHTPPSSHPQSPGGKVASAPRQSNAKYHNVLCSHYHWGKLSMIGESSSLPAPSLSDVPSPALLARAGIIILRHEGMRE